jgi:flavoprotein
MSTPSKLTAVIVVKMYANTFKADSCDSSEKCMSTPSKLTAVIVMKMYVNIFKTDSCGSSENVCHHLQS